MKNIASYHAFLWYTYRTTHCPEALELASGEVCTYFYSVDLLRVDESVEEHLEVR
jgi:hypothetical protein